MLSGREVVLVSAARTPIGSFQGALAGLKAPELGALVIREAVSRAGISAGDVNEVLMGCVLPAGVGQAPARQAAIFAGLPKETPCTTVNKVCGSGLKAVMLAAQAVANGDADVVVAGGMESMTNVPYYLPAARAGMRLGNGSVVDGVVHAGLWDVYNHFHMGSAAELCARELKIDRAAAGRPRRRIVPERAGRAEVGRVQGRAGLGRGEEQEGLGEGRQRRGAGTRRPGEAAVAAAVVREGRHRHRRQRLVAQRRCRCGGGDGAREVAEKRGLKVLARIRSFAQAAQAPEWFTTAPAVSIERALAKAGLTKDQIDLYEINEAFSVVAIANNRLLGLDAKKVNVNGGAVALGHPIGASGARILTTLLYAMAARDAKRGCASLCIGGGEAVAMIVER